jgi:hypothetical protein
MIHDRFSRDLPFDRAVGAPVQGRHVEAAVLAFHPEE